MVKWNKHTIIAFAAIFLVILAKGLWSAGWYEAGILKITGKVETGKADLSVQLNSGNEYNPYETRHIPLTIQAQSGTAQGIQHIKVKALGIKHPESEGSAVSLLRMYLDGKEFPLKSVKPRSILRDRLAIQLTEKDPVYEFDAHATSHVRFVFANSFYFGQVEITVNGESFRHDLYSSSGRYDEVVYDYYLVQPDGTFSFDVPLPRYQLENISLRSNAEKTSVEIRQAEICYKGQCTALAVAPPVDPQQVAMIYQPNKSLKRFFDPIRFVLRIVFALLTTVLIWWGAAFVRKQGGFVSVLSGDGRILFWGMFTAGCAVNAVFLFAFWPGLMSQDSIMIWRAAGLPDIYMNHHPVLNMMFYMFLKGIWNNPAIVSIVHIVLSSTLVASCFYWLCRQGVSMKYLIPFYLLVLFSLPINLYSIALWKDIPFALLVVLWGMGFVVLYHRGKIPISMSGRNICLVIAGYLALGLFRYNGMVYFAAIPVFLLFVGILPWKKTAAIILCAAVMTVGLLFMLKNLDSIGGLRFLSYTLNGYYQQFQKKQISHELLRTGEEYLDVFDMDREGAVPDKWHYYLYDRYSWDFLRKSGFGDYYPYQEKPNLIPKVQQFILKLYEKSYETPLKYLVWNPMYFLFLTLIVLVGFFRFPRSALYSGFLVAGVLPILFLEILNWRYFYFFYFGLHFLPPLMVLDWKSPRTGGALRGFEAKNEAG